MNTGIDRLINLLEEADNNAPGVDWSKPIPINRSWLIVDGSVKGLATDSWFSIEYSDGVDMKLKFIEFIQASITPEIFNLIRTGELRNLTFRIGPDSDSGTDLYQEHGGKLVYSKIEAK